MHTIALCLTYGQPETVQPRRLDPPPVHAPPVTGAPSLRAILEAVDLCELQLLILLQETEDWVVSILHTKHNASGGQHEVERCSARP